jgi:hypothetical protein
MSTCVLVKRWKRVDRKTWDISSETRQGAWVVWATLGNHLVQHYSNLSIRDTLKEPRLVSPAIIQPGNSLNVKSKSAALQNINTQYTLTYIHTYNTHTHNQVHKVHTFTHTHTNTHAYTTLPHRHTHRQYTLIYSHTHNTLKHSHAHTHIHNPSLSFSHSHTQSHVLTLSPSSELEVIDGRSGTPGIQDLSHSCARSNENEPETVISLQMSLFTTSDGGARERR